ncbi:hypothetical protein QTP70_014800, partial [Hemibagrus guttatus]
DTSPQLSLADYQAALIQQGALIREYQNQVTALQAENLQLQQQHQRHIANHRRWRFQKNLMDLQIAVMDLSGNATSSVSSPISVKQIQPAPSRSRQLPSRFPVTLRPREDIPETKQLGRVRVSEEERRHHTEEHLCYYSGNPGHLIFCCPERPPKTQLPTVLCTPPLWLTAVNNEPIGEGYLYLKTKPPTLTIGLFHTEQLMLFVISSPTHPIILGLPWLQLHDPIISWKDKELTQWSSHCFKTCLITSLSQPCFTMNVESLETDTIITLRRKYSDLQEVFSTHLPPHRPWDCAIDLFPNAMPAKSRVYPLSLPETKTGGWPPVYYRPPDRWMATCLLSSEISIMQISVLPKFHQHVDFATRGTNTLYLVYTNIPGAYRAEPCPHLGYSDHISVMLIPAYRPLVRRSKPVLKQVKTWPAGAISALQDCFECTDWNMFREAATNGHSINLEEYTTSVTSYVGKCIDDVTVSKTITTCSNQKPWMTAEVRALLKLRDSAFKAGDKEALRTARAKLS